MDERPDIVVAGAGHNSLIAACYLAKAGYRCLVLDARHVPGGGAATEEILLPGYGIDTCATGHTLIRVNPLLTGDELGLIADYGLCYIDPDPVAHVAFPDGEQLTMWLDRDRTAAEIARFSAADAAAYLRLLNEYDEVKSVFSGSQFTPVGFGPSLDARLAGHPRGRLWQRRRAPARAPAVVRARFHRRCDPRAARQVTRRLRAAQPAHGARRVPWRRPRRRANGAAAPGTGLGLAPDADRGPVPDGRNHPPRRLHHRRPRAERGHRAAARPRPRPGRGDEYLTGP